MLVTSIFSFSHKVLKSQGKSLKVKIVWSRVILYQTIKNVHNVKLKEFTDNKSNVTQKWKFVLGKVKNIVQKGENADYPFPTMFSMFSLLEGS